MFHITDDFDENIFSQIIKVWEITGIGNPVRGDNFSAINLTLKHGGKMFSILANNIVIATCWLTHDYRRAYIHHMAVLPEYQKRGLGQQLLVKALEYSKELGLQSKLEVYKDNYQAQSLYRKLGFKLLDGYEVFIKRDK